MIYFVSFNSTKNLRWGIISHREFTLLPSSASQFSMRKSFRMDGRRLRWGGECFSCCITSCGRPSMTSTQSKFSRRLKGTELFLECDLMAVTVSTLQSKDSLPAQTFGRQHSRNWTLSTWVFLSSPTVTVRPNNVDNNESNWLEFAFAMHNNWYICTMYFDCLNYFTS